MITQFLNTVKTWWDSVPVQNWGSAISTGIAFVLGILHQLNKKKYHQVIVANQQTVVAVDEITRALADIQNELIRIDTNQQRINEMLFTFANSTNIREDVKKDIAKLFGDFKTTEKKYIAAPITQVQNTAENITQKVNEVTPIVEDVAVKAGNVLDELRSRL